ncbi:MAG: NADH-quinone oxidoreductase subunit NuoB [Candidatus Solibacter usitatus]|nr:NADH-quinone oxidoreductase subunit NuoB [Candidatus Solibacter usitatus]
MFKILTKTARTGLVTIGYPNAPAEIPEQFRGAPAFDFALWRDARPEAAACPTGAISVADSGPSRSVTVDYGLCTYCGECAETGSPAVRMTRQFAMATRDRLDLVVTARYGLNSDGSHRHLEKLHRGFASGSRDLPSLSKTVGERIAKVLGGSLAIREVDAGSCNGCELEISALHNPVYDLERLGIHFVASPRHADLLLVTGPVTRNMELALWKTYQATPDPKVVVAVGACGISGGIYGQNYATAGSVADVVPVDVYIPGCPPRPHALLHGILMAIGRMEQQFIAKDGL